MKSKLILAAFASAAAALAPAYAIQFVSVTYKVAGVHTNPVSIFQSQSSGLGSVQQYHYEDGWEVMAGSGSYASTRCFATGWAQTQYVAYWEYKVRWIPSNALDLPNYSTTYQVVADRHYKRRGNVVNNHLEEELSWYWDLWGEASSLGTVGLPQGGQASLIHPGLYSASINQIPSNVTTVLSQSGPWEYDSTLPVGGAYFVAPVTKTDPIYGYFTVMVGEENLAQTDGYFTGPNFHVSTSAVGEGNNRLTIKSIGAYNIP